MRDRSDEVSLTDLEANELYFEALKAIKEGSPFQERLTEKYGMIAEGSANAFLEKFSFIERDSFGDYILTSKGEQRIKDGFVLTSAKEKKDQGHVATTTMKVSIATLVVSAIALIVSIFGLLCR